MHRRKKVDAKSCVTFLLCDPGWCVCVCVFFFLFILDIKFVGRTRRGHTGGRSHRIFHPPSFCGACLKFSREKDSAVPFPRLPCSRILCTKADSYGNEKLIRKWTRSVFFSFFFDLMGTRMVQIRIAKSV